MSPSHRLFNVASSFEFESPIVAEAFAREGLTLMRRVPGTSVYQAGYDPMNRVYAVKAVDTANDPEALERVRREAQAGGGLQSEHVVRIEGLRLHPSVALLLMEWISGETVKQRLALTGKFSLHDVFWISHHIARALSACDDAGIVHRDVKPSNAMIVHPPGGREIAKLIDFGIVGFQQPSNTTRGSWRGTPRYMSPEQCSKGALVGARSDVYQWGLLVYEMLTGHHYCRALSEADQLEFHRNQNSDEIDFGEECPEALADLIKETLRLDPGARPSIQEVMNRVDDIRANQSKPHATARAQDAASPIAVAAAVSDTRWRFGIKIFFGFSILLVAAYFGIPTALRTRANLLLKKGVTALINGASGRARLGHNELEKEAILALFEDRPQEALGLLKGDLAFQNERTVYVPPFSIEQNEVTWQQFANWLNTLPSTKIVAEYSGELDHRYVEEGGVRLLDNMKKDRVQGCWLDHGILGWAPNEGCEIRPVERMSKIAAESYCEAIGRSLMSEDEYEVTARGATLNRYFPWGNNRPTCDMATFDQRVPPKGHRDHIEHMASDCPAEHPQSESVRTLNSDETDDHVRGLFGNVAELTSSLLESPSKPGTFYPVVRGTSYLGSAEMGVSSYRSVQRLPTQDALGFRCVAH